MYTSFPVIDMKATGLNIKKARERRGVSVKELQDFLGFDAPQAIYKWQRGETLPSFDNMYAITCYLNVSIDEILVGNREDFLFDKGEWLRRSRRKASFVYDKGEWLRRSRRKASFVFFCKIQSRTVRLMWKKIHIAADTFMVINEWEEVQCYFIEC